LPFFNKENVQKKMKQIGIKWEKKENFLCIFWKKNQGAEEHFQTG
jgi:hypothetical protein